MTPRSPRGARTSPQTTDSPPHDPARPFASLTDETLKHTIDDLLTLMESRGWKWLQTKLNEGYSSKTTLERIRLLPKERMEQFGALAVSILAEREAIDLALSLPRTFVEGLMLERSRRKKIVGSTS